jgi:hypothetical protein
MRFSFHNAWSPPNQAERRVVKIFVTGGHGPFRGLEAPLAPRASLKRPLIFRKQRLMEKGMRATMAAIGVLSGEGVQV